MLTFRQVRGPQVRTQEMLADKALVAPMALKRLESESGLKVREDTRGAATPALAVHRAAVSSDGI